MQRTNIRESSTLSVYFPFNIGAIEIEKMVRNSNLECCNGENVVAQNVHINMKASIPISRNNSISFRFEICEV